MNDIKPTNPVPVPAYYIEGSKEDEISLVDLFVVLYRRKMVILGTLVACTALAVLATFFMHEKITYTTSIKIGGNPPVESNTNALTKITESYIPATKNAVKDNDALSGLKITARAPEDSDLVILSTQTVEQNHEGVQQLHKMVADRLIADHEKQLDQKNEAIKNHIENLRLTLDNLKNSTYLTSLRDDIKSLRKEYLNSQNLSDNVKLDMKDELRSLQSKLIDEQKSADMKSIDIQSKINDLKFQIETTPKTSLNSLALKTDSKGRSPILIIALGIILGGILGIFAAFMVEFIGKVKEEEKKLAAKGNS